MFAEKHPVEKLKRIALGPLTLEGLPVGRYRLLGEKEVSELRRALAGGKGSRGRKGEEVASDE